MSHHDLLSNAVIKSNNARGASSGAEGSSVQESQGVSNHGDLLSSAGIDDSGASSAPRDKEDDQVGCSQEKFEVNNTGQS